MFVYGEDLTAEEEEMREAIVRDFISVGILCEFTEKQLMLLLYAEILDS